MSKQNRNSGDTLRADDIEALLSSDVGETPTVVDALVSQQAHAAVRGHKAAIATSTGQRHLARFLPVAAVLVVSVGITVHRQQTPAPSPDIALSDAIENEVMEVATAASVDQRSRQSITEASAPQTLSTPAPVSENATIVTHKIGSGEDAPLDPNMQIQVNDIVESLARNEPDEARELVRVWQEDYPDRELMAWLPEDTDPEVRAMLSELLALDPSGTTADQ